MATITIEDSMMADFEKDMSNIVGNLFDFAFSTIAGEYFIQADDDTANIANPENYYPKEDDWEMGGPVFTNPSSYPDELMRSKWVLDWGLDFFRFITGDPYWYFNYVDLFNFWFFYTRDNKYDYLI
jgi:hypothetical protein